MLSGVVLNVALLSMLGFKFRDVFGLSIVMVIIAILSLVMLSIAILNAVVLSIVVICVVILHIFTPSMLSHY